MCYTIGSWNKKGNTMYDWNASTKPMPEYIGPGEVVCPRCRRIFKDMSVYALHITSPVSCKTNRTDSDGTKLLFNRKVMNSETGRSRRVWEAVSPDIRVPAPAPSPSRLQLPFPESNTLNPPSAEDGVLSLTPPLPENAVDVPADPGPIHVLNT